MGLVIGGVDARGIGRRLLFAALMGSTCIGAATFAMKGEARAQAARQAGFDIPAGPLSAALAAFGRQSGIQVAYVPEIASGKRSAGISGAVPPREALARILAGTGLSYQFTRANAVTITDRVSAAHDAPVDAAGATVLGTIDVTGTGGDNPAEAPFETPGSTAYISEEQLQRIRPSSVGEILRGTPGVFSGDTRNGVALDANIRGMQGMGRNAVMVDGTMQNNSMYVGYRGNRDRVYVDPDLLGGISIEKGPSGGEHGAGIIGGVINMRTLEAGDIVQDGKSYGFRVRGGLASNTIDPVQRTVWRGYPFGANTGTLSTDKPEFFNGESYFGSAVGAYQDDRFEFVAGVTRRKQGNYFAGSHGSETFTRRWRNNLDQTLEREDPLSKFKPGEEVTNTSQDVLSGLVKGKLKFGNGHSLELGYIYYDNDYGELSDSLLWWGDLSEREPSFVTTHTGTLRYAWKPDDNPLVDFHVNLWTANASNRSPNNMNIRFDPTLPSAADTSSQVRSVGGEIWNSSRFDDVLAGLTIKYGGQYYQEDIASQTTNPFLLNDMNGTRAVGGVFAQADLGVTDWLSLGGSLRYDTYRATDTRTVAAPNVNWAPVSDSGLSPRINVTLKPWEGIQFYAAYEQGWRPPSLRELMFLQSAISPAMNSLRPEVARNYEIGMNVSRADLFQGGDTAFLKLAYFDNTTKDYISRLGGNSVSYNFFNVDSVRFRGVEATVRYDTARVFGEANLSYYTDAEYCMPRLDPGLVICDDFVKGADYGSPYIPPRYSGSLTLGTRWLDDTLTLGGRVSFAGRKLSLEKRNAIDDTQWKPYAIVDLFGSYKINDTTTVDFSAENIFDRYYVDALARSQMPAPGRTVRLNMTAKF